MGDSVDRKAATQAALEFIVEYLGGAFDEELQKKLMGRMNALPSAQPEQQWIPCSERLPEEGGYYLTTTMYQEVYCDYWNGDNFDRTEMVIAWMPLPEPWKGEDNGQNT